MSKFILIDDHSALLLGVKTFIEKKLNMNAKLFFQVSKRLKII